MKSSHAFLRLVIGAIVASLATSAHAQTAEEAKAYETLMRVKMYISDIMNNGVAPGERGTVFAAVIPGIGIHEKRDGTDAASTVTMPFWVLNTLPSTDLTGNTSAANISEIYRRALFDGEPKDAKTLSQQEADAKKVEDIDKSLKPYIDAYLKGRTDYITAMGKVRQAQITKGVSSPEYVEANAAAKNAMELWRVNGEKKKYENIVAERNKLLLSGSEPWLLWRQRFANAIGDIESPDPDTDFAVRVYPEYPTWSEGPGWMELAFGGEHTRNYTVNTSVSGSASGRLSILGIGGGASGNYSRNSTISQAASESMSFKMKVKRVLIHRAWGDPEVFRSPNWHWKKPEMRDNPLNMISQGKYDKDKQAFLGLMPLYPTSLILAKDIEITAKFSTEDRENITKSLSGSAKGGFWFFRTRASASRTTTTSLEDKGNGFATLKIPDPQIIGYICEILPPSPSPSGDKKETDLGGLKPGDL
ncbi:MAG: hypothetical protein KF859_02545 [Phycisphaeraceae bacterium]|nr:hypothetical protein [Phycisphaeraceae bacterium]